MGTHKELAARIRKLLPAHTYGLRYALLGAVHVDQRGTFVLRDRDDISKGWDCSDAAFRVQELLSQEGIDTRFCYGKSEDETAKVHWFVRDNHGTIYDATPMYPTIGARHTVQGELTHKEFRERLNNRVNLSSNCIPITWYKENGFYVVAASTSSIRLLDDLPPANQKVVSLFATKTQLGHCQACAEVVAIVDTGAYKQAGLKPLEAYSPESAQERIRYLQEHDVVMLLSGTVWPAFDPSIPPDISSKLDQNLDVLCSLLEKQAVIS